jgi:serine/threonine protein kinase
MSADLSQLLKRKGHLNHENVRLISFRFLEALSTVHKQGIIHWDIKLENVLIDHNLNVLIADFGLSRDVSKQQNHPDLFKKFVNSKT